MCDVRIAMRCMRLLRDICIGFRVVKDRHTPLTGVLEFDWSTIPAGHFLMGNDLDRRIG